MKLSTVYAVGIKWLAGWQPAKAQTNELRRSYKLFHLKNRENVPEISKWIFCSGQAGTVSVDNEVGGKSWPDGNKFYLYGEVTKIFKNNGKFRSKI